MVHALWTFAVFSLLLSVVPGPDSLLVLNRLLRSGRRAAVWTAVGACMGTLGWGAVAACGVATVLLHSATLYHMLKLLGVGYLIVLGLLSFRAHGGQRYALGDAVVSEQLRSWKALRTGLACDLANPKVGLFFVAVIPQFLPAGYPPALSTVLFVVVDIAIALAWFIFFVFAAHRIVSIVRHPRARRSIERLIGCVLIGFGVAIASEHQ